ncbi:MAG: cytochrome-c peroxidase [Azoarcus sp.]|jgi:cytochrome c peroxidase|nr:cytochrome-c peroxidase [Azoarcus sp.]
MVTGIAGATSVAAQGKNEPIQPITPAKVTNPGKVELGKKLFFDPRLSKSGFISCNSCHNLSMGGSDNLPTSIGDRWQQGPINSPTVLNSSLSFVQFWDGRAKDLQEQAAGPIANPKEMAFTHELTLEVLNSIPQYRAEFAKVYGNKKLDMQLVTDAIAEFEKTLVTPNSRFDQWLKGNKKAITAEELKGYELFKSSGCVACHNGEAVGGNSFQKMGVFEPYKTNSPEIGRAGVTKEDADRFFFKVPTLRNVELTYPYFHDGVAKTLEEAVDLMGRLQLAKKYTPEEVAQIVAFLKTLTGDQPKLQLPILPPSQNNTPQPKPFN